MSSLEERREARRRRRQAEEDGGGTLCSSEISDLVDARLQQRRLERRRRKEEERELAASSPVNGGEDDLERRRRERREARLRGGEAPAEETSRRSRRNEDAEETTTTRSRRRRGGDEEEAAPEPTPAPAKEEEKEEEAAPEAPAAAEEDDSAAREAEEAERRRQQEAEEERRRQEEERRRQQEDQRRQEEERKAEEARKRKNSTDKEPKGSLSVRISASSPPSSDRHHGVQSLSSEIAASLLHPGSARSGFSACNTGRSALSECVFSYTSDDGLSDLAMENEQLMSSDCELGSSFDESMFHPGYDIKRRPSSNVNGGNPIKRRKSRSKSASVSPLAKTRPAASGGGGSQDGRRTSEQSKSRGGRPDTRSSTTSPDEENDSEDYTQFAEERGTIVTGDRASQDMLVYRSLQPGDDSSENPCDTDDDVDDNELASPRKAASSGSSISSALSRQDSGGFDYEANFGNSGRSSSTNLARDGDWREAKRDEKRLTPFAYHSSGFESPMSDRDECLTADSSSDRISPVRFTSKKMPAATGSSPISSNSEPSVSPVNDGSEHHALHQRSDSSPVHADDRSSQAGHQRSVSSPANPSVGRHHDISSRMSELQRQLQVKRAESSAMRKMHSQGDLSPSSSAHKTNSAINDLIGQLSNRLKKRELAGRGDAEAPEHSDESFSLYRSQSEPVVNSMEQSKLEESPRAPPPPVQQAPGLHALPVEREDSSSSEDDDMTNNSMADHDNIHLEERSLDASPKEMPSAKRDRQNTEIPPLHASVSPTLPTPGPSRPKSGQRGGRPEKIKEELRLCLDFLDDVAEDLDSEDDQTESEKVGESGKQKPETTPTKPVQPPAEARYMDTSYCSSTYEVSSSAPDYYETDDMAEDEASYTQGVSAYFSEDSFSQAHPPAFGSAWDRDRAASMSDIMDKENVPFIKRLLRDAARAAPPTSASPPLPPPPVAMLAETTGGFSPAISPPPPPLVEDEGDDVDADVGTPPITPPPPVSEPCQSPPLPASPPPPMSPMSAHSPIPFTQLPPPAFAPTPPPPPPPPPPPLPSAITETSGPFRGPAKWNQTKEVSPKVIPKVEEDLHAKLCAEILLVSQRMGSKASLASLAAENGCERVHHLIRPSALVTDYQQRADRAAGSVRVGSDAIKRLRTSEPVFSNYEIQDAVSTKTAKPATPKWKASPLASPKMIISAQDILATTLRKTNILQRSPMTDDDKDPEVPEGTSLVSFWLRREDSFNESPRSPKCKQSLAEKPKPLVKSQSAMEFRSAVVPPPAVEPRAALVSSLQNLAPAKMTPAETPERRQFVQQKVQSKKIESSPEVAETTPKRPAFNERRPVLQDNITSNVAETRVSGSPVRNTHAVLEKTTPKKIPPAVLEKTTPKKIPPPTLPKSTTLAGLHLSRNLMPENSTSAPILGHGGHSRMSSTSSIDSEVFTLNRHTVVESQIFPSFDSKSRHSTADSAQEPERKLSCIDSDRQGERKYSSTGSAGKELYRHFPSIESDTEGEVRRSAVHSAGRSQARYNSFDSDVGYERRHSSVDPNQRSEQMHSYADHHQEPAGRRYSLVDRNTREGLASGQENSSFVQSNLSQGLLALQTRSRDSPDFEKPHIFERRRSYNVYNRMQTNDADASFELVRRRSMTTEIRPMSEDRQTATVSRNSSESDAPKKRSVPKPKFNARRLTQGSDIPSMWKCSEDAMTEYKPRPITPRSPYIPLHTEPLTPANSDADFLRSLHSPSVSEGHKTEYKSWAASFLKDRILTQDHSGSNTDRSTHSPVHMNSERLSAVGDSRDYSIAAVTTGAVGESLPARTHKSISSSKPMSISERINLLKQSKSPKPSTSTAPDIKPGSVLEKEGPDFPTTPKARSSTAISKPATTSEQKRFASILQNRLINIIAEEDAEAKSEKVNQKERVKKTSAHRKLTASEEIARSRALASGSRKSIKAELPTWAPELTSSPAATTRPAADSQLINQQKGSVMDMAKEFDHLTDSLSKEDERERRKAARRRGSARRLSTGMTVKEMKSMFDNPDSLSSSCSSSRASSPKIVSSISERVFDKFDTPTIAENRPVVGKDMVLLSRIGARSSVFDIVNKVENSTMETTKSPSRKTSDSDRALLNATATTRPAASLVRTDTLTNGDVDASSARRYNKMDKSRRFTTGVNFAELQQRFTNPSSSRKRTNQSRSIATIYASSQEMGRHFEFGSMNKASSSARSMENLGARDMSLGVFRPTKHQWERSAESLNASRESVFEKPLSRSGSYELHPDIQSTNGSAFSRVSTIHSPIKVTDPSPPASSGRTSDGEGASACYTSYSGKSSVSLDARFKDLSDSEDMKCWVVKGKSVQEEEERMEAERQEQERKQQEEEERRKEEEEKKKKKKRKGLGGLSPEKKKLLKKLIMQKAAEDLRNEAKAKALEKEQYINERVTPLNTSGIGQDELKNLVKELHKKVSQLEEEVYDWEIKIRKQDFEINELTLKVNDTKGKFIKPVLRKVNKTESKLNKLQTKESRDFRGNLKSTGQNKFALKEEDESSNKPDWRDTLKHGGEGEGEEAAAES